MSDSYNNKIYKSISFIYKNEKLINNIVNICKLYSKDVVIEELKYSENIHYKKDTQGLDLIFLFNCTFKNKTTNIFGKLVDSDSVRLHMSLGKELKLYSYDNIQFRGSFNISDEIKYLFHLTLDLQNYCEDKLHLLNNEMSKIFFNLKEEKENNLIKDIIS